MSKLSSDMSSVTTVAVDLAKHVFQVHGCDASGKVIVAKTRDNDAFAWGGGINVNRGYTANGLNQYTLSGAAVPTYDTNGNLIGDGTSSYGYDAENRLISKSNSASLSYDPLGRLWQVTSSSTNNRFLYDGDQLALEYDVSGNVARRYAFGDQVDQPILEDSGGALACGTTTRYLNTDIRGSIIAQADCSGNRTAINAYDEYGIPAATNVGRFQYTGQAWLPELGMYYYKARVYSPTLGRFMQTDPIGVNGGINIYAYAGGDPVNLIDPSGLKSVTPVVNPSAAIVVTATLGIIVTGNSSQPPSQFDLDNMTTLTATYRGEPKDNGTTDSETQNGDGNSDIFVLARVSRSAVNTALFFCGCKQNILSNINILAGGKYTDPQINTILGYVIDAPRTTFSDLKSLDVKVYSNGTAFLTRDQLRTVTRLFSDIPSNPLTNSVRAEFANGVRSGRIRIGN